jgi:hypothetical protein
MTSRFFLLELHAKSSLCRHCWWRKTRVRAQKKKKVEVEEPQT